MLPAFVIDPLTKPVTWIPVIVVPAGLVQPEFGGGMLVGHAAKAGGTPPPTKSAATELDASNSGNLGLSHHVPEALPIPNRLDRYRRPRRKICCRSKVLEPLRG
jgi:hypothetical protein